MEILCYYWVNIPITSRTLYNFSRRFGLGLCHTDSTLKTASACMGRRNRTFCARAI